MSNEELVVLIQNGERDHLPELWTRVERFVAKQANRRLVLSGGLGGVEFGDLYNAGYLALAAAVDTYDPLAGMSFIGWLAFHLKSAFAEAGGYRSRKQARDPIHRAGSLDAPAGEEEDGATLGELVPDPAAEMAIQDVDRREDLRRLHAALEAAIAALPPDLRTVIRGRYYRGEIVDANAHNRAMRILRAPRCSQALRVFL